MSTFALRPKNCISMFAQRIANFHVCLMLSFLLTWILCPLWLSILIPAFTVVYSFHPNATAMIWLYVADWNILLTVLPYQSLVMLPSPLTQSGKVRQWLWIKASRSNELITGGSAFSTELKALCYYVFYADKRHIVRASIEVHLIQFLSTVICWGRLALQIGAGGLWSGLWPIAADLGLLARVSVQNANYLIINILLLEWILTHHSSSPSGSGLTRQDYNQTGSRAWRAC